MLLSPEKVADYLMMHHVGCNNPISGDDLVTMVCGRYSPSLKRDLSDVIGAMRTRGFPVYADGNGYYWATDTNQVLKLCKLLRKRAMTALRQITKLRNIAIPDLAGQLRLPVGSEPELPNASFRVFIPCSMQVEIPEDLHEALQGYLEAHPMWDADRVYVAALSLFLLQQGSDAHAPRHYYLEVACDDE